MKVFAGTGEQAPWDVTISVGIVHSTIGRSYESPTNAKIDYFSLLSRKKTEYQSSIQIEDSL